MSQQSNEFDSIVDEVMQDQQEQQTAHAAAVETDVVVSGGARVLPFPSDEARAASEQEWKERKAATKARVEALMPYFRIWVKRTQGRDARDRFRAGEPFKATVAIDWVIREVLSVKAVASFAKAITEEFKGVVPPPIPENVTSWEVMSAFMQVIRRYNFGMMKAQSGYILLCHSNHKRVQAISTGEDVWSEPTELQFELWRVANGDYDQPWVLSWAPDPEDPSKRIQIKQYTKVQSVLKPWDKNKEEPEMSNEDERRFKLISLKEGEQMDVKFEGEHESEAEEDCNTFLQFVTRQSEASNIRFEFRSLDPWNGVVAHNGKLYR